MITTHTLGQVYTAATLAPANERVHTDWLTLQAGSVTEQLAFNHRLFGLEQTATKSREWFDSTQYYNAPVMTDDAALTLDASELVAQVERVAKAGYQCKAVILGPVSLVWSVECADDAQRLALLDKVLPLYAKLLSKLGETKLPWLQLDEPMLSQTLSREWTHAYRSSYFRLQRAPVKIMVASSFGALNKNLQLAAQLPVQALHIDACRAPEQVLRVIDWLPRHKILSLGVVSAESLVKADLGDLLARLQPFAKRLKERLWLATNLSFQHLPVEDMDAEVTGTATAENAFVLQKIRELNTLAKALTEGGFSHPVRLPRSNRPDDVKRPAKQVA